MAVIKNMELGQAHVRYRQAPKLGSPEQWFQPSFWQQQQAVIGQSKGRNTVWFVADGERELVLRHYYRGGLPGKLIRDLFCYTGLERTRSMAEFNLLDYMQAQGLPVPKPVAARVYRLGLSYQADILIERVPASMDLFTRLQTQGLNAEEWQHLGAVIAQFHKAGVQHSDLNCHNILISSDQQHSVWLIDFDRCDIRQPGAWQERNLKRLKRSLQKERSKFANFFWQEQNWQQLLQGYNGDIRKLSNQ